MMKPRLIIAILAIISVLLILIIWSLGRDEEVDERVVAVFAFLLLVTVIVLLGSGLGYLGV